MSEPVPFDLKECDRCGGEHQLLLRPLTNPPWFATHFAMCPVTREPVLLTLEKPAVALREAA